jgi:hypothetical protein
MPPCVLHEPSIGIPRIVAFIAPPQSEEGVVTGRGPIPKAICAAQPHLAITCTTSGLALLSPLQLCFSRLRQASSSTTCHRPPTLAS